MSQNPIQSRIVPKIVNFAAKMTAIATNSFQPDVQDA